MSNSIIAERIVMNPVLTNILKFPDNPASAAITGEIAKNLYEDPKKKSVQASNPPTKGNPMNFSEF